MFGLPDIVRGGFGEEVSPVGAFGSFDGLKVAEFGLSGSALGVRGAQLFRSPGGFSKLLSESGQERGPPGLRPWGRARAGRGGLIAAMSMERAEENHRSSWLGEGGEGGEGQAILLAYP